MFNGEQIGGRKKKKRKNHRLTDWVNREDRIRLTISAQLRPKELIFFFSSGVHSHGINYTTKHLIKKIKKKL